MPLISLQAWIFLSVSLVALTAYSFYLLYGRVDSIEKISADGLNWSEGVGAFQQYVYGKTKSVKYSKRVRPFIHLDPSIHIVPPKIWKILKSYLFQFPSKRYEFWRILSLIQASSWITLSRKSTCNSCKFQQLSSLKGKKGSPLLRAKQQSLLFEIQHQFSEVEQITWSQQKKSFSLFFEKIRFVAFSAIMWWLVEGGEEERQYA